MPSYLISGPAGSGKTQVAEGLLAEATEPTVLLDFQAIFAALSGAKRGPDGRYPLRDRRLLPITEYVRQAAISAARERQLSIILTNSDSAVSRRSQLLSRMLGRDVAAIDLTVRSGRPVSLKSPGNFIHRYQLNLTDELVEQIVNPGEDVVLDRLAEANTVVSDKCLEAYARWSKDHAGARSRRNRGRGRGGGGGRGGGRRRR